MWLDAVGQFGIVEVRFMVRMGPRFSIGIAIGLESRWSEWKVGTSTNRRIMLATTLAASWFGSERAVVKLAALSGSFPLAQNWTADKFSVVELFQGGDFCTESSGLELTGSRGILVFIGRSCDELVNVSSFELGADGGSSPVDMCQ